MPRLNRDTILYNISDARAQLQAIEKMLEGKKLSEIELQIAIEHAYHHLNFAWNCRHASDKRHKKLSDEDFNEWSKFPEDIEIYNISSKSKPPAKS